MAGLWWELVGDGPGPPLVLVPEASRPAAAWPAELVSTLAAARPVVRLDLRDQGRSPWSEGGLALADLVADVVAVLAGLGGPGDGDGGRAHLLGWGLGGAVALEVALAAPALVDRLTLVGSSGWLVDPSLPGPDEPTAVALVWRSRGGTEPDVLARALGRELRALCGPDERPDAAAALREAQRWVAWGFNPHDRQRAAWLAAPARWEEARRLRGRPVTVVHGTVDPLVPPAHGARLAGATGARLVEVPGAGHELTVRLCEALVAVLTAG